MAAAALPMGDDYEGDCDFDDDFDDDEDCNCRSVIYTIQSINQNSCFLLVHN